MEAGVEAGGGGRGWRLGVEAGGGGRGWRLGVEAGCGGQVCRQVWRLGVEARGGGECGGWMWRQGVEARGVDSSVLASPPPQLQAFQPPARSPPHVEPQSRSSSAPSAGIPVPSAMLLNVSIHSECLTGVGSTPCQQVDENRNPLTPWTVHTSTCGAAPSPTRSPALVSFKYR